MMKHKGLIFTSILFLSMSVTLVNAQTHWVVTERWTEPVAVSYFNCPHVEWKVTWDFKVKLGSSYSIEIIDVDTLESVVSETRIGSFVYQGKGEYTHNRSGRFQMVIDVSNDVTNFVVLVVQNIESIPEFPSWIILPLFISSTICVIIVRNKIGKKC